MNQRKMKRKRKRKTYAWSCGCVLSGTCDDDCVSSSADADKPHAHTPPAPHRAHHPLVGIAPCTPAHQHAQHRPFVGGYSRSDAH